MSQLLSKLLAGFAFAPELEVTGVETDSRRVTPGDAFLAVRGVGSHGLSYVETALANGAAAVVWEPAPGIAEPDDLPVPQVAVAHLSKWVGAIAARFHDEPASRMFCIGVTGTDGKTSTAWLVAQALDALGSACGYLGTIGYGRVGALREASHTTPDPIRLQELFADFSAQGLQAAAMEVSSHALDQARVAGIAFDAAVLTNVTRDHLDYHGTIEAYAAAKKKLFADYCKGELILNRDDVTAAAWADEFSRLPSSASRLAVYGIDGPAPSAGRYVLAREVSLTPSGLSFTVDSSWGSAAVQSRLLGRFNAYNLLAVLAVLLSKGVALPEAAAVLAQLQTVPGRIEGFRGSATQPLVVVDYAHTPEALAQILRAVRAHSQGRLLCVFGCGGDRDRGKRPLMGQVAVTLADAVFITDDNPRSENPADIVAEILAGIGNRESRIGKAAVASTIPDSPFPIPVTVIQDRAEAIRAAIATATANDVVVIAGKGHETTQTYGTEVRAFSDRSFVAQLLGGASA
jgi:UDP-N-acetylmuramoyl-L-alanyl-D-glutamate--2,6-diaminopimelate ligase